MRLLNIVLLTAIVYSNAQAAFADDDEVWIRSVRGVFNVQESRRRGYDDVLVRGEIKVAARDLTGDFILRMKRGTDITTRCLDTLQSMLTLSVVALSTEDRFRYARLRGKLAESSDVKSTPYDRYDKIFNVEILRSCSLGVPPPENAPVEEY